MFPIYVLNPILPYSNFIPQDILIPIEKVAAIQDIEPQSSLPFNCFGEINVFTIEHGSNCAFTSIADFSEVMVHFADKQCLAIEGCPCSSRPHVNAAYQVWIRLIPSQPAEQKSFTQCHRLPGWLRLDFRECVLSDIICTLSSSCSATLGASLSTLDTFDEVETYSGKIAIDDK